MREHYEYTALQKIQHKKSGRERQIQHLACGLVLQCTEGSTLMILKTSQFKLECMHETIQNSPNNQFCTIGCKFHGDPWQCSFLWVMECFSISDQVPHNKLFSTYTQYYDSLQYSTVVVYIALPSHILQANWENTVQLCREIS